MATRVGLGTSTSRESRIAGREAALVARESLNGSTAAVVFVFATAGHDQATILAAVADVFPNVPLTGCSAEGIITRAVITESSHAVAMMAIASSELTFSTYSVDGFATDSRACGERLARTIRERGDDGRLLLLFPDGLSGNCSDLIRAVEAGLPRSITVVGGTAGDLLTFERTYQYHDGDVCTDSVSAVLIGGSFEPEVAVKHGCDLIGSRRTITGTNGGWVYTIDDQSAWTLFQGYLESGADDLEALHVAHLLLAEHLPIASSGVFDDFSVRVPVRLDKESGALYFAAGLTPGAPVQVAHRNAQKVCTRAERAVRDIAARRPGQRPLLVIQLDCAGRGRLLLGDNVASDLIAPMFRVFDADVPWIGLNTYGEIGPIDGRTYFHNYTAVLCALYRQEAGE